MAKLLFGGSLVCIAILVLGSFLFPQSILMELASTSIIANVFRATIGMILLAVLVTSPPRRMALRVSMGTLAAALIVGGLYLSFGDGMHVLDAVLYLQLGCALGIEALEFNEDELWKQAAQLQKLYKLQQLSSTENA